MPSSSLRSRLLLLGAGAAILLGAGHASANYTAALNGTTLEVTGDNRGDDLALQLDASGTMLVVDVKNDGTADFTFDRSLFNAISVSAGGGDDMVLIDESAGAFTEKSVTIDGGPGRDTLIGGSGNDIIIGGDDDDFVDAKRGNDTIFLGAGDDVAVWHPGDGSDVIEGQDDDDRLEFTVANISEHLDVSANGGRVRLFRDVANITMDLDDVEEVDLATLGGADVVTVNDLTGTDLVRVNVDLESSLGGGTGDGQPDSIVLTGTAGGDVVSVSATDGTVEVDGLSATVRVAHGEPALDSVDWVVLGPDEVHVLGTNKPDTMMITPSPVPGAVRASVDGFSTAVDVSGGTLMMLGLGGGDTISGSNGLAALGTSLVIDGGPGDDVITGGDGVDVLIGGPGSDTVSGARGNDLLLLGSGSDTAVWRPGDGNDTIEGQEGSRDTLDFQAANISENIDVSANGGRVRLFRDVANITMDLNDVEQVGVSALGGADHIVVNDLSGTDVKGVTVDLEGVPGGGTSDNQVDSVVVNGTPAKERMRLRVDSHGVVSLRRKGGAVRIEHPDPTDALVVNGLGGGDKIHASPSVSSAMMLTINPN